MPSVQFEPVFPASERPQTRALGCVATAIGNNNNNNNNNKPVIIGATGAISKSLRQYLSNKPGAHEIKELQNQPYWAMQTY